MSPQGLAHRHRDGDPKPTATDTVRALAAATCSDGAPSARNLIVTVFGDVVLPNENAVGEVSVQALTRLLEPFAVNERLVRTSLSRIVGDGLLLARSEGRRSHYSVADGARPTFARADRRIYRSRDRDADGEWDGEWTIVVIDGRVATASSRAALRRRLGWAGFGAVAPNVLASPVVDATAAAEVVGDTEPGSVMITRSRVLDGAGLIGADHLVRRALELDSAEAGHRALVDRFGAFDDAVLAVLDDAMCLKLRLLMISVFRRVVLSEPAVPDVLLPAGWPGHRSRDLVARIYRGVAARADRRAGEILGAELATVADRFGSSERVGGGEARLPG